MPAALLTLNTAVPVSEHPGTPAIVVYDNGDWEIAFQGDVDYIREGSSNYLGYFTFIDLFVDVMIFFDIGDVDDLDVSGDRAILFIEEQIATGEEAEPVMLIYGDGEFDVMHRSEAEGLIELDPDAAFNFIPLVDLFKDFAKWRGLADDEMLWGREINEIDPDDEDAEPEDI